MPRAPRRGSLLGVETAPPPPARLKKPVFWLQVGLPWEGWAGSTVPWVVTRNGLHLPQWLTTDQARRREEVTKSQTQGPRALPEHRRPSIRPCSEPLGTTAPAAPGAQPVDPPTYAAL